MREKETYRDHLVGIRERFGDNELIAVKEVAAFCGVDERTLKKDKTFPKKKIGGRYFVSAKNLASWLAV